MLLQDMLYVIGWFDFHELVTGDNIWIQVRPNRCGVLFVV